VYAKGGQRYAKVVKLLRKFSDCSKGFIGSKVFIKAKCFS